MESPKKEKKLNHKILGLEFHFIYDEDGDSGMPVITLEVLSDSSNQEQLDQSSINYNVTQIDLSMDSASQDATAGVHFLTEKTEEGVANSDAGNEQDGVEKTKESPKARHDLLEYMIRDDGSVVCKLCGEVLQSRTHWYRHKYKLHVIHPLNPAPLFQCEQCLVYFKSRKGYIGHIASRHSEVLADSSPVLTNAQAEALARETVTEQPRHEFKEDLDPELAIPKTSVPNYQTTVVKQAQAKGELRRSSRTVQKVQECTTTEQQQNADWVDKRSKEEKLVADIIDRVRRECEARGTSGSARRGYSRKTTVMNT